MKNNYKFSPNIMFILEELDKLQTGCFFENTKNPNDQSAQTISRNIKKEFSRLLINENE